MIIGGGSGQWVRARNEAGAKALMQERQLQAERHDASRRRSQAFWRRTRRRIRSLWNALRSKTHSGN